MTEADETHWIIALIGSEIYFHWRSVRMVEVQVVELELLEEISNKSVTIRDQESWLCHCHCQSLSLIVTHCHSLTND